MSQTGWRTYDGRAYSALLSLLRFLMHGVGSFYILSFLYIAWQHLGYPFELEWMEGGMLDHVRRLVNGQALYVPPSLEFIPFSYTPLYFLSSAALCKISGVDLFTLRLLSIVSTLLSMFILLRWAQRETRSWHLGWFAVYLFAATYGVSGSWWTLARVDMLFTLLLLGSGYLLRQGQSSASAMLSGFLLALSFFCKQTGLLIAVPMMFYVLIYETPLRKKYFLTAFLGAMAAGIIWYQISTRGWFLFYCYEVPGQHPLVTWRIHHYWLGYYIKPLPLAFVLAAAALIRFIRPLNKDGAFWLFYAVAVFGGSWITQIPSGSYDNVAIPGHAVLALLCAIAAGMWLCAASRWRIPLLWAALIIQLLLLHYDPGAHVPGAEDLQTRENMLQRLQDVQGPVWMPGSVQLATQAGHAAFAHRCAVVDVLRTRGNSGGRGLSLELQRVIASGRYEVIVMDDDWLEAELRPYYDRQGPLVSRKDELMPLTGWKTRPLWWYTRKNILAPGR